MTTRRKRKLWCPVCSRQWEPEVLKDADAVQCPDCGYFVPLPWEPPEPWEPA